MSEAVVRICQGFFEPEDAVKVSATLSQGRLQLEPALKGLRGLLHYYVSIDADSHSMVNVSIWESLDAARQMDTLPEMLAQREAFTNLGVKFQPIRNYVGLWAMSP